MEPIGSGRPQEDTPEGMLLPDDHQCAFMKSDSLRCQAKRQRTSPFCFTHDPDKREQRIEAWKRGGETTASFYKPSLPSMRIEQAQDVVRLVTRTINEVRTGKAHPQVANTVFYGAAPDFKIPGIILADAGLKEPKLPKGVALRVVTLYRQEAESLKPTTWIVLAINRNLSVQQVLAMNLRMEFFTDRQGNVRAAIFMSA